MDSSWHYYDEKERCIFCDIIRQERDTGERVIGENDHFITLAPYAPRFPFEMWLLPKVHGSSFENNQSTMYASLARMLKDTLMRLDVVLDRPAYNFMIHTSPVGEEINDHYHWHFEIIPSSPKLPDSSGALASISIPRRRKSPRGSCARPRSLRTRYSQKKRLRRAAFSGLPGGNRNFAILTGLARYPSR